VMPTSMPGPKCFNKLERQSMRDATASITSQQGASGQPSWDITSLRACLKNTSAALILVLVLILVLDPVTFHPREKQARGRAPDCIFAF
jgi:hypothetical protein